MTATTERSPAPPAVPRAQDLPERVRALRVAADRACILVATHLEGINGERRDETGRVVREMDPILYGCALAGPPGSLARAMHILRRQRLALAAQALTAAEWAWTVTVAPAGGAARAGPGGAGERAMSVTVGSRRRGDRGRDGAETVYVGRPSALGNPYHIGGHVAGKSAGLTREEAIDLYERWLRGRLESDTRQRRAFDVLLRALAEGRDLTLCCWCRSEAHGETGPACHADVIRRLLAERAARGGGAN